jgi:hypothetical protein
MGGKSLRFAGTVGETAGVSGDPFGESSIATSRPQFHVSRTVDSAHATFAEFGDDAVVGDQLVGTHRAI